MASPNQDGDSSSMFMLREDKSPVRSKPGSRRNSTTKATAEIITVKDFFDFMKTAYQVYEHLEGEDDENSKINWEELTKLTVLNHVIDHYERDLLAHSAETETKVIASKSDTVLERKNSELERITKRISCSEVDGRERGRRKSLPTDVKVEMLGVWTETNLNCKLNDVMREGILDSILPYLVGYRKPTKTTSVYVPIIKKTSCTNEIKKPASFGGFLNDNTTRDRLGRRKSSINAANEKANQKQDGEVEIHVCDEVKGLKKDFRCPQRLLITKMCYFADVTAGQRLEDMDISVHCDIQIFDWLMRWVKRDTILVADWPILDPANVVPILVSASFLQMEPLLHDCLIYCHAHINDIVKTSTNLACLSDTLLTRLAAMYTNIELEAIRDRKDKIHSRLYCKMILSLAEPVPETIRGHYATLATLFKCNKCNKVLGRHIAEHVPCQPANMRIDRRGNVLSTHAKDISWSLNEYITWLYGELRSWRRVYWRLWADCHFLKCQMCDTYFPAYQMDWCTYHEQPAHMFTLDGRPPLPVGRYPCCGERAYKFEILTRNTGCQFRSHVPAEGTASESAIMEICEQFRDIIAMRPPQLVLPERLTRLVGRELGEDSTRLYGKEVFWWTGIQLVPPRQALGLLGKMYTNDNKFNPEARPGSPSPTTRTSNVSLAVCAMSPMVERRDLTALRVAVKPSSIVEDLLKMKSGLSLKPECDGAESDDSSSSSEEENDSEVSEEDVPHKRKPTRQPARQVSTANKKRNRVVGRQWVPSLSARSNQDGQRRFEERVLRQMKAALIRRSLPTSAQKPRAPTGGVYAKLEADWREIHCQKPVKPTPPTRTRQPMKYKI